MKYKTNLTKLPASKVLYRLQKLLKINQNYFSKQDVEDMKKNAPINEGLLEKIMEICSSNSVDINKILFRKDELFLKVPMLR